MPFDERPHDHGGGGDGDPGHDPEGMKRLAAAASAQVATNAEVNGLCTFHAYAASIDRLLADVIDGVRSIAERSDDPNEGISMRSELAQLLRHHTKAMMADNLKETDQ